MTLGNQTLAALPTTIFSVMSALAVEQGAINLGQGFPEGEGPEDLRQRAAQAILDGPNQYPPMPGLPVLRQAVAAHDQRFYGLNYDWQSETLVTSGATEALTATLLALLNPGDEVVLFEPAYDSYAPIVRLAGATPRFIRLNPPDYALPEDAAKAFGPKTRLVLLNSPMNPIGKVFTRGELDRLAQLMIDHDALLLADEVYEHLVFAPARHIATPTLPGMFERTVRVASAGKTFSLTGWKVGYLTGPKALIGQVMKAHQFLTFTTPPALQIAVAHGLAKDDSYFTGLAQEMATKRDRLAKGLAQAGFGVLPCDGTYFLTADIAPLKTGLDDLEFCRKITIEAKVAAIPLSAFYEGDDRPRQFVRFCFSKNDAVLDEAVARLSAWAAARQTANAI